MNESEARRLSVRIIDTWPGGAKQYIWQSLLAGCTNDRAAWAAYETLKKAARRIPTTGEFLEEYDRAVARLRAQPSPQLRLVEQQPVIDSATYVERLRERAKTDPDAAAELAYWEHLRARPRPDRNPTRRVRR